MEIRKASREDISSLSLVYDEARKRMYESGNRTQWAMDYPPLSLIESDISNGFLYCMEEQGEIIASFSVITGIEPNYSAIYGGSWPEGEYEYVTIHRVAGKRKAHHVLENALKVAFSLSPVVRIDTHKDNRKMQALIAKYGFSFCGFIRIEDGSERLTFQKSLIPLNKER